MHVFQNNVYFTYAYTIYASFTNSLQCALVDINSEVEQNFFLSKATFNSVPHLIIILDDTLSYYLN